MTVRLYEWDKTETGWAWIEITDNKVVNLILRNLNNLIKINSNNEVYVDLQLDDNLQSSATLPVWVTTWRVVQANWRPVTGTLISAKTTSGDVVKILYGDDWEIRVENGDGTWETLQFSMTAGTWINITNDVISNTWVTSVNGQIGDVTVPSLSICEMEVALYSAMWANAWVATITSGTFEDGCLVIMDNHAWADLTTIYVDDEPYTVLYNFESSHYATWIVRWGYIFIMDAKMKLS